MATSIRPDHSDGGATPDPQAAFIEKMAAKYEKEDAASGNGAGDEDDETPPADDADDEDDAPAADDDTEEQPNEDTPADDPDGDAAESGEDSKDDEADEHPAGDDPDDSDDEKVVDDDPEADEDDEEPATDATKAALAARGADVKLEDIPDEYQGIVKSKLKSMDSAFTRVLQDATAFRAERTQFEADKRFRDENPEFALVEAISAALAKDPDIFEKVNDRFAKLDDPDQKAAFEIVLKDKRAAAVKAVETEHGKLEQRYARADFVEKTAKDMAAKAGLPWRLAERAVVLALKEKEGGDGPDLTDEELTAVIAEEAREYTKETRAQRRSASKDLVKNRTANRSSSAPPAKRPAAAAPPRPAAKKAPKVDNNSEESRIAAILGTARRVMPGVKDE